MRAVEPAETGVATSPDGVRIAYEVFGAGDPTIVFLPSTPIVHSRQWKGQVPYLSRHYRVVAFDGRGNGGSDRPSEPAAYHDDRYVDDVAAVLDGTGTEQAVLVGLCVDGVWRAIRYAEANPSRVLGLVAFAVGVPRLVPSHPWYANAQFDDDAPTYEGWAKLNRHHWRRDYADFARFFFQEITSEPHSTKVIEDAVGWALDGSVEAMIADSDADFPFDARRHRGDLPRRDVSDGPRPRDGGLLPADRPRAPPVRADRSTARRGRGRRPYDPGPPSGPREPAHP